MVGSKPSAPPLPDYGSVVGPGNSDDSDDDALSDKKTSLVRHLLVLTLAYPMLTVATPLTTLFILYMVFDCLDQDVCFKADPGTRDNPNATAIVRASPTGADRASLLNDAEIRLICLISLMFATLLVGTLLVLRVKRDGREVVDALREPLVRHV